MNRPTFPQLALPIAGALLTTIVISAATVKRIHPANSAPTKPPIVIAVIADHYTAAEEKEFNYDVANFFKHGLMIDSYYKGKLADLEIVSYFEATPPGQASNYGFQIGTGTGNCAVTDASDTVSKIETLVGAAFHTVVIGNHPYNFGCTVGRWTYVAVDAVGSDVLQHELGHVIARLYDEWAAPANGVTPYPKVIAATDTRNCFDTRNPGVPHWSALPGAGRLPGCDLYQVGVEHAFGHCRMGGSHATTFCKVCEMNMDASFAYYRNPSGAITGGQTPPIQASRPGPRFGFVKAAFATQPTPVPPPRNPADPRSILRLLVSFDPSTNALAAKKGFPVTARYIPEYRRHGEYVYEVLDFDKPIEVGVLPDQLFVARGYRGGGNEHQSSAPQATDVIVQVAGLDAKAPFNPAHSLSLRVYRLLPTVTDQFITPAVFAKLKLEPKNVQQVAALTPQQFRAAFQTP